MICPYCGETLDWYEEEITYPDEDTMNMAQHFACYNCDRTFWRDVVYKVTQRGELYE